MASSVQVSEAVICSPTSFLALRASVAQASNLDDLTMRDDKAPFQGSDHSPQVQHARSIRDLSVEIHLQGSVNLARRSV